MTQDAVVTKRLANDMAEVVVTRGTACGSNCGNCESCMYQSELKTLAHNLIDAVPGQRVVIESKSSWIFSAALLVYILPLALALVGYALAYSAGAAEGTCIVACFAGLVVGGVVIVLSQRLKKDKNPITFDIVQFGDGEN